jgi:hypothetical protein
MAGTDTGKFKLKKDPETEQAFFKEMSINIDLLNDKLPSDEELVNRSVKDDKYATDRSGSIDDLNASLKKF